MQDEQTKQPDDDTEVEVADDGAREGVVEVVVEDCVDEVDAVDGAPEDAGEAEAQAQASRESAIARAILALQQEVKAQRDAYVRAVADADNYRKRARRDIKSAAERAEDKVVCSFLPVMDNLERALAHAEGAEDKQTQGMADGVRMVIKQFEQNLERFGIKPFTSIGEPFDPELHEAIQQMPSDYPANTVALELHRGYKRVSRLVRPAMVAVSAGPPKAAEDEPKEAEDEPKEDEPKDQAETQSAGDGTGGETGEAEIDATESKAINDESEEE